MTLSKNNLKELERGVLVAMALNLPVTGDWEAGLRRLLLALGCPWLALSKRTRKLGTSCCCRVKSLLVQRCLSPLVP